MNEWMDRRTDVWDNGTDKKCLRQNCRVVSAQKWRWWWVMAAVIEFTRLQWSIASTQVHTSSNLPLAFGTNTKQALTGTQQKWLHYLRKQLLLQLLLAVRWQGGAMGTALGLQSTGRGFKYYSGQKLRNNLGQAVHTYVPLSPSSITWYQPSGSDALQLGR